MLIFYTILTGLLLVGEANCPLVGIVGLERSVLVGQIGEVGQAVALLQLAHEATATLKRK